MRSNPSPTLSVAVPWSLPQYIIANGFHPLYRPFFIETERFGIECIVADEVATARSFGDSPEKLIECLNSLELDYHAPQPNDEPGKTAAEFYKTLNLCLPAAIPGDLEFHHTCALATGDRAFVFHCEAFLPILFPFFKQGEGLDIASEQRIEEIRQYYKLKLETDSCLAIVSHIKETLEQIKGFFQSERISSKLHHLPIGIDDKAVDFLSSPEPSRNDDVPTFLFTGSAHQNASSFRLRGGVIALRLIRHMRSLNRKSKFIFRCAKPTKSELGTFGIADISLESCEYVEIEWLTNYLSDAAVLNLFKVAHFYLLPSANLHSISIMQAMAAGCVPVVSDTQGTQNYVENNVSGVVVEGALAYAWQYSEKFSIWFDSHSRYILAENALFDAMLSTVLGLLDDRNTFIKLSNNARVRAQKSFRASAYVPKFWKIVSAAFEEHTLPEGRQRLAPDADMYRALDIERDFGGPPAPIYIESLRDYDIYRLRNVYWALHNGLPKVFNSFLHWSVFSERNILYIRQRTLFLEYDKDLVNDHVFSNSENQIDPNKRKKIEINTFAFRKLKLAANFSTYFSNIVNGLPITFDSESYLLKNPDVAENKLPAAKHYKLYGKQEGRTW